jgi:hypothetical protein
MSAAPCKNPDCHAWDGKTCHTTFCGGVRMQPRDETAARLEFERAKRLVESYGWTVTAPECVGCESIGPRA